MPPLDHHKVDETSIAANPFLSKGGIFSLLSSDSEQCNDHGDTKSFGCARNESWWECKPHTETVSFSYERVAA